jgi:lipopolysaccharide exporter
MIKFRNFIYELRHNKTSNNRKVLILASGTTIAQALSILFIPIISRLYTPKDYAIFALFTSLQTVLQAIATGRYEYAVMLPKREKDSYALVLLSFGLLFTLCMITFIFIAFFRHPVSSMLGNNDLAKWLWFLPFAVFVYSSNDIVNYWGTRSQLYKQLAISRVFATLCKSVVNIGYRLVSVGPGGLIAGAILSQIFPIIYIRNACNRMLTKSQMKLNWARIKFSAKKYQHFPLFTMPNSLLNVLSAQLPIILISRFFTQDAVGSYSYAMQMMMFPMAIIGGSVGQVFYQNFSQRLREEQDVRKLLLKTWKRLAMLGVVPLAIIFLWGEVIFSFIFGSQWAEAGRIAAVMAPSVLGVFISAPTSSATLALNLQKATFFFGVGQIIYRPLALYIGHIYNNLFIGLYIYVAIDIFQFILYNYIIWQHLPKTVREN